MLSQWCQVPVFVYTGIGTDGSEGPVRWSGHVVCMQQRWHKERLPDHASADELESWDCDCVCHTLEFHNCPTLCDSDCDAVCHEEHEVSYKRTHEPPRRKHASE